MENTGKELWARIDFLRNKKSIRELAEETGINERVLQSTRSMQTVPQVNKLYPIAQALDTTVDYLYSGIAPEDKFDGDMFEKLASNQEYVDIVQKMFKADELTLEMIRRILGFEPTHYEIKTIE